MYFSFIKIRQSQLARRPVFLSWALMTYVTILFAMSTTYIGTNIRENGKAVS